MRVIKKISVGLIAFCIGINFSGVPVSADASVKLTGDKETCAVGDSYKVSLSSKNTGDASIAPEISITYDPNRLSFTDCNVNYGGGGGGLITINDTSADIIFSVISGGAATVEVSAVFGGDGANVKTDSITLNVDGEDTAALMNEPSASGLGIEGGLISGSDGVNQVATVFADEFMPMGFNKIQTTYEEQLVEAAKFDMGDIVLLYVTDESGNNGNFKVYNQSTGELSDFLQISGIENRFIIVLRESDVESAVPNGFSLATLKWNDQTLDAYAYNGVSDFFLLYAISSEGNKGWYLYDQKEGTYQRFEESIYENGHSAAAPGNFEDANITDGETKDEDSDGIIFGLDAKMLIIIGLGIILLIVVIVLIIMGLKIKEFNSYEYIDEDEYEQPARKVTAGEIASRQMNTDNAGNMESRKAESSTKMQNDNGFIFRNEHTNERNEEKSEANPVQESISDRKPGVSYNPNPESFTDFYNNDVLGMQPADETENDAKYISREEKKALKAEEKARKKAEKKMKKEYGEFGPADFSHWQEVVRDDRKVSEEDIMKSRANVPPIAAKQMAKQNAAYSYEMPATMPKSMPEAPVPETPKPQIKKPEPAPVPAEKKEPAEDKKQQMPFNFNNADVQPDSMMKKDSPAAVLKKLPANDYNAPVQPKPVQQFDLDEDFEFEYINLDDDD